MVYNSESDSCREVTVTPNAAWGGEGRYFLGQRDTGLGGWANPVGMGFWHPLEETARPQNPEVHSYSVTVASCGWGRYKWGGLRCGPP